MKNIMHKTTALLLCIVLLLPMLNVSAEAETSSYADLSLHVSQSHPRLYVSSFEGLKEKYLSDPITAEWYEALIARADNLVANVTPGDGLDYDIEKLGANTHYRRIIASQAVLERFYTLAFAAAVEQNEQYAARLWAEIEIAANLPSWNPFHWLEVAEMIHSFAIAYDWCYNFWDSTQKSTITNAMKTLGLEHATREYDGNRKWYRWVYGMDGTETGTNWTVVCNTGVLFGALAMYEEDIEFCNTMINNAIRSMRAGLNAWSPDGSYRESIMYWNYAARNLIMAVDGFENAIGGDFSALPALEEPFLYDFSLAPGISKTPDFPIYGTGNDGVFNYGDTVKSAVITSPAMMWIGNRFGVDHYTDYHIDNLAVYGFDDENLALNLLWYNSDGDDALLPADNIFEDDFVTLRSSWDSDGIYASLKGGINGRPHQHFDLGTFVVDAFGTRFINVLGASNYDWESDAEQYYLRRPEGSNTIVVNPDSTPGQNTKGGSEFESFYSGDSSSYAILDMTDAYSSVITSYGDEDEGTQDVVTQTAVTSARRGIKLFKDKSRIMVQDEIKTSRPSEVYWFAHTDAAITIQNGGKSALLTKSGKNVYLNLLSNEDVSFEVMTASPLATSPAPEDQRESYGTKLAVHADNITNLTLAVEIIPTGSSVPSLTTSITSLDEWHPESDVIRAGNEITVYGTDISGNDVTMYALSPMGELCGVGQMPTDADSEYKFTFNLPHGYDNGAYTIYINGSEYKTFEVTDAPKAEFSVTEPEFSETVIQSGNMSYSFGVTNIGSLDGKFVAYLVLENNGELISIKTASALIDPGETQTISGEINIPSPCDDYKLKLYVWHNDVKTRLTPVGQRYVFDSLGGRYE